MFGDKKFWIGFALAYLLAVVLPPQKLMGSFGGKKG